MGRKGVRAGGMKGMGSKLGTTANLALYSLYFPHFFCCSFPNHYCAR